MIHIDQWELLFQDSDMRLHVVFKNNTLFAAFTIQN